MQNRLSQQLLAILDDRNISQTHAAKMCGMSLGRFHNYINGSRTPDVETLARMAQRLGVSADYLLGLERQPPDFGEVVLRLLELEGIDGSRAQVIADAAQEALSLLLSFPDEGDARTRSRMAAQAAWRRGSDTKPPQ